MNGWAFLALYNLGVAIYIGQPHGEFAYLFSIMFFIGWMVTGIFSKEPKRK